MSPTADQTPHSTSSFARPSPTIDRPDAQASWVAGPIIVGMGTRPEVIKLAPVVAALRKRQANVVAISSGQHGPLAVQAAKAFGLRFDEQLGDYTAGRSLGTTIAQVASASEHLFHRRQPSWVVVQGDTASAFGMAVAAFLRGIPVAHVEAGLRTNELASPFPEEGLRQMLARIATLHFAPTDLSRSNLLREGIAAERIRVVGNTIVDALYSCVERASWPSSLPQSNRAFILLVTCHRRENLEHRIGNLLDAIRKAVRKWPQLDCLVVSHPNPMVANRFQELRGCRRVFLIKAVSYLQALSLLQRADLVITDSGGLIEEATCFSKRVIVFRTATERIESVDCGAARLAVDADKILGLMSDAMRGAWRVTVPPNVFGDGRASDRIVEVLAGAKP